MYILPDWAQAKNDMRSLPQCPSDVCWFCQQYFKEGQKTNYHHRVAARYIRALGFSVEFEIETCVKAHVFCHVFWHMVFDPNGDRDFETYRQAMLPLEYGRGLFSQASWLLEGYLPSRMKDIWLPYHPMGDLVAHFFASIYT